MDVTPLISSKNSVVQSYGPTGFRVSGKTYDQTIMVHSDHVAKWDATSSFEDLSSDNFKGLDDNKPDVLLIGTGTTMKHISPELRNELKEMGWNIETMDTGAACRTFNALMSDGRHIAALLFLPV
jgi:uncharacterized protein